MKKYIIISLVFCVISLLSFGQKKVAAVINLTVNKLDSVVIDKGKSFVVQLPVHNRYGDDWKLASPPLRCHFTQAMLGEAGMLPNQPEPKLMFFKAIEKGVDSIRFIYKNPKADTAITSEERTVIVSVR